MIAIIDYDAGNIMSVEKACTYLGGKAVITRDRNEIFRADHVILPGVGSFGDAMGKLNTYGLVPVIRELCEKGTPFMGICLGLQLMFCDSEESPGVEGLSVLPGHIKRIPAKDGLKIPQIGWNDLDIKPGRRLFSGLPENPYVYFVHSYYLSCDNEEDCAATTEYGTLIHAAVEHENIFACQFHPEKSSGVGLKILENFMGV